MTVTLSDADIWKERIERLENPINKFLAALLSSDGNVTSQYDHAHRIFNLVWKISRKSPDGWAQQSEVIKAFQQSCRQNREDDQQGRGGELPETLKTPDSARQQGLRILGYLVKEGALLYHEDKQGKRNPKRVLYQPHPATYLNMVTIPEEYREEAIGHLKHNNFRLEWARGNLESFIRGRGLWGEFLQGYLEGWGKPYPRFISDGLGVREAQPGEIERRRREWPAQYAAQLERILGPGPGEKPEGEVRRQMEATLAKLRESRKGRD